MKRSLLLGGGAGLLAALLLAPATGDALATLARERAALATLRAEAAAGHRATPLLAPGWSIPGDAPAARAAMIARIQTLAKAGGILVEETSAAAAPPGITALRLRASGAEKAVLAFSDALERSRPLMRLRSWRFEPIAAGGVRLTGDLLAVSQ